MRKCTKSISLVITFKRKELPNASYFWTFQSDASLSSSVRRASIHRKLFRPCLEFRKLFPSSNWWTPLDLNTLSIEVRDTDSLESRGSCQEIIFPRGSPQPTVDSSRNRHSPGHADGFYKHFHRDSP